MDKLYNINISGLNTLLIPMKKTDIVSIGMYIKAGSINETAENNGVAHFLEHLMFKSTNKRPNKTLLKELDNLGTYYNAGTTRDHTYYEINGNKNDINEIIDIMLDLYSSPIYEKDEIELEKGVIIEELKMYQDNTMRTVYDGIISNIFRGTPLEKLVIGTEKNIQNMTVNQLSEFRKLYTLNNSILVLAGNFNKNEVIDQIKKCMKLYKFNNNTHTDLEINYNLIKKKPNVVIIPNEKNTQSYIFISFYFESISFQEESIIKFLCDYLSTGSTSLLFEVLRNKLGASYSNESDFNIFAEKNGMFYITCNVNNTLIEKSLIEILSILKNLKDSLISDEEIVKVKKIFDTTNLFQINNPSFIMKYHGKKYLYEKTDNIYDEIKYIKNINAKLINDLTNKLFQRKNLNIYIYGNELNQSNIAKIINDF
jgi:predicted Zn-dependent peptidase